MSVETLIPPSPPPAVDAFLHRVRRRLRVSWAVATLATLAPVAAGVALALVAAGRLRPWAWTELAALAVGAGTVVVVAAVSVAVRIPLRTAALAADRGLRSADVLATSLEVDPAGGGFAELVGSRARALATGRAAAEAVPLRVDSRRWTIAAVIAMLALLGAVLPNPQDDVRARREAERAALAAEAGRLKDAARAIERAPEASAADKAIAERLDELAEDLARAPDVTSGQRAIDQAAADLGRELDPNLLAQKAATRGLERSLEAQPLPGAEPGDASSQLGEAADELDALTPEEQQALSERLGDLADSQAAGNPKAGGALQRAASELAAGNTAEAAEALREAAEAQGEASGDVERQEAAAEAVGALAQARGRLGEAGETAQQGQGQQGEAQQGEGQQGQQGQGQEGEARQGEGQQGQGREGEGQQGGQGQGQPGEQGQGQGQGQGQEGEAQGRGGNGQDATRSPGGGGQGTGPGDVDTAQVYTPMLPGQGPDVAVEGQGPQDGSGEIEGREEGPTGRGYAHVPLNRAYPYYRERASEALDTLDIPPSMRSLVRAYFDALGDL